METVRGMRKTLYPKEVAGIPINDVLVSHPSLNAPKGPWLNDSSHALLSSLHSTVGHAPSEPFASVPDGHIVLSLDNAVALYTNIMVMED
ncbi:hypothetical protein GYMLUDRAFT_253395 [Collybiopsis luxurians FD-317 M1]|uniref:Uncharacterized protein n=1 Tax=Collybiopsis luxurians FD-317 M1 TaxID=944289 RepID=A0A0D0B7E3_9AGAR|nr:hypothetical protein GYMLUDRAFT_253395 [Collybiopsis luxurians FD-317 M1]